MAPTAWHPLPGHQFQILETRYMLLQKSKGVIAIAIGNFQGQFACVSITFLLGKIMIRICNQEPGANSL